LKIPGSNLSQGTENISVFCVFFQCFLNVHLTRQHLHNYVSFPLICFLQCTHSMRCRLSQLTSLNELQKRHETRKKDYSVIKTNKQGNVKLIRSVIMYSLRYDKPKDDGQCDERDRVREHASKEREQCRSLDKRQTCTHSWELVCDRQFVCCLPNYLIPYSVTSQVPLMAKSPTDFRVEDVIMWCLAKALAKFWRM
jgi:arginine utilization protein RocB